jgi:oligopeptidase B
VTDNMVTYNPADNVNDQNYPAMLITCGLHDSRVNY